MRKNLKWFCLCASLMGTLLGGQKALAFNVSGTTAYLHADGFTASAFDEQLYDGSNFNSGGFNDVQGLDFSLTHNLDAFNLGTFTWKVTNNTGGALTNTRFFTLLDSAISFFSDSADQGGFTPGSGSQDKAADYWEIDYDDLDGGNIVANLTNGVLDNSDDFGEGLAKLALGFDIGSLGIGDSILTTFTLGDGPGLKLSWAGFDGHGAETVYFNGTAEVAPVPEPGTILLLGSGLSGMILARRRKKA